MPPCSRSRLRIAAGGFRSASPSRVRARRVQHPLLQDPHSWVVRLSSGRIMTMAEELEFRLLRVFVAVAEDLHFTRAAQRLFIAQQAVSRDVRRLEERLGVTLLDRGTRLVTLTPA